MRILGLALVLSAIVFAPAYAWEHEYPTVKQTLSSSASASASSRAGAVAVGVGGNANGGSASVGNVNVTQQGSHFPASTAYAPALAAGSDTCMGSTSAGGQGMSFGLSFGTTWRDENCVMLKDSRQLAAFGLMDAAIIRMCMDDKIRESMRLAGTPCPQDNSDPNLSADPANPAAGRFRTGQ